MTSDDELLTHLDGIADMLEFQGLRANAETIEQAAARIRELEAALDDMAKHLSRMVAIAEGTPMSPAMAMRWTQESLEHIKDFRAAQEKANG